MEEIKKFREIEYEIKGKKGLVLIGESITDIDDIKSICRRDYIENIQKEINLDEIKIMKEEL